VLVPFRGISLTVRLLFCLVGSAAVIFVGATAAARSISSVCVFLCTYRTYLVTNFQQKGRWEWVEEGRNG
jgi:hypothetical protein